MFVAADSLWQLMKQSNFWLLYKMWQFIDTGWKPGELSLSPELPGLGDMGSGHRGTALSKLRWTERCSLRGWDVTRHSSARADFPGIKWKCWKMERKWGIWWVDDAKVIHYMLSQEVIRLPYLFSLRRYWDTQAGKSLCFEIIFSAQNC